VRKPPKRRRSLLAGALIVLVLAGGVLLDANALDKDLPGGCAESGGKWLEEFRECEYTSRDWCDSVHGKFDECASACRHRGEDPVPCTMQCVPMCSFAKDFPLPQGKDPENCTYRIESRPVTLVNGVSKEVPAPGSPIKITTRILLTGDKGYLNDDEYPDIPVVLLQTTVGSGSFFYAAAALGTSHGMRGTGAVWAGDRILPQAIEVDTQSMVFHYADRYPWESYATAPSVARSRSFLVEDGQLREKPFAVLSPDIARKTVVAEWGDCSPDACSVLRVSVWDGGGGAWYIEAIYDGMLDDSVKAQKRIAPAVYRNGEWTLGDPLVKQVKCHQGRGHGEFSEEPCN